MIAKQKFSPAPCGLASRGWHEWERGEEASRDVGSVATIMATSAAAPASHNGTCVSTADLSTPRRGSQAGAASQQAPQAQARDPAQRCG